MKRLRLIYPKTCATKSSARGEYGYESLRLILEKESGKPISAEEARRVGDGLMAFYGALLSPDVERGVRGQLPNFCS
jgi:hypothetical protein